MTHRAGCPLGRALGLLGDGFSQRVASDINLAGSPGFPDIHASSSLNRGAYVNGVFIVLAPHTGNVDHAWRSSNLGVTWTDLGVSHPYSGGMVADATTGYVYWAYIDRGAGTIGLVKFAYDGTPGSPTTVYSNAALQSSQVLPVYRNLSICIDSAGRLIISTHWESGSGDHTFVFVSDDDGATWDGPIQVSDTTGDFHYTQVVADAADTLLMSWRNEINDDVRTSKSTDHGATWSATVSHAGTGGVVYSNPSIETNGPADEFHMWVQSDPGPEGVKGVYHKYTTNGGTSWSAWALVEATCGYGDPRGAPGRTYGEWYCHIRSNKDVPRGVTGDGCGMDSNSRLLKSTDNGLTWVPVDQFYYEADGTTEVEACGTRAHIIFQRHRGGGPPLFWFWLQRRSSGTILATYHDINTEINLYS